MALVVGRSKTPKCWKVNISNMYILRTWLHLDIFRTLVLSIYIHSPLQSYKADTGDITIDVGVKYADATSRHEHTLSPLVRIRIAIAEAPLAQLLAGDFCGGLL